MIDYEDFFYQQNLLSADAEKKNFNLKKYDHGGKLARKSSDPNLRSNRDDDVCSTKTFLIYVCVIIMFLVVFSILLLSLVSERDTSTTEYACSQSLCKETICSDMRNGRAASSLCYEFCVTESIPLKECSQHKAHFNLSYRFFAHEPLDSTLVCPYTFNENRHLKEDITLGEFDERIRYLIRKKVHHEPKIDLIVENLYAMADANQDRQINAAEAGSIYAMLNSNHILYMLILAGRPYTPTIKNQCGSLVEIERMTKLVLFNRNPSSFLGTLFTDSFKWDWPEWSYRAKIALGILEFFIDAVSFNPNDEFGKDTLYLCSPIESSFGHTFNFDAKLINYDHLITGYDLEESLNDRRCTSDEQCIYNSECKAKCNLVTNKCTGRLVQPQITKLCTFMRGYLLDNANYTSLLVPLIEKCEQTLVNIDDLANYKHLEKNEISLNYDNFKKYLEQKNYWNNSLNYATVTNELHQTLWKLVRYVKDPPKRKSKPTPSPASSEDKKAEKPPDTK